MSTFKKNRVPYGEVIKSEEFARRLAYELQLPQRYGTRIHRGISRVISDAIEHGEGVRFNNLGTIRVKKHSTDDVLVPGGGVQQRTNMFKVKFDLTARGRGLLEKLTRVLRRSN